MKLKSQNAWIKQVLQLQACLSNKGWGKSMKELRKLGLTKVTKTEDDLIVELTE